MDVQDKLKLSAIAACIIGHNIFTTEFKKK